jgi:type IX secretion system substrate protein
MILHKTNIKQLWFAIMQVIIVYTNGQNLLLNGSFENNLCNPNFSGALNMSNHNYDSLMSYSHSFGSEGNIDICNKGSGYCGAAENGIWYLGLTSGGTDAFSLELSSSIISGKEYSLQFYTRADSIYAPGLPIKIGVSTVDSLFGSLIYIAPTPLNCQWLYNFVSFTAPMNANYITITCGGSANADSGWVHVDNFVLDTGNNTTSIKSIHANEYIQVSPNPANTNLNIACSLQLAACSLYDVLGNEVYAALTLRQAQGASTAIDVSSLPNGVYFLNIKTAEGVLSKKVIVQH